MWNGKTGVEQSGAPLARIFFAWNAESEKHLSPGTIRRKLAYRCILSIETSMQPPSEYYSLVIYTVVTLLLIGVLLLAAWWLGEKTTYPNKGIPYESGVIPTGSARLNLYIPFYLIAIFLSSSTWRPPSSSPGPRSGGNWGSAVCSISPSLSWRCCWDWSGYG